MTFHLSSFSMILFVSCLIDLFIAYQAWQRRTTPGSRSLMFLMLAIAQWSLTAALTTSVNSLQDKIIWAKAIYIGLSATPPLFLIFCMAYTHNFQWINARNMFIIWSIPFLTIPMVFTNEKHLFFWSHLSLIGPQNAIIYHHGTGFYLFTLYAYATILTGIIIFFRYASTHKNVRLPQIFAMALSLFFPLVANILYVFDLTPFKGLDLTPLGFSLSGIILLWSIYRLHFLDLSPIAREKVIDSMQDCLLVIDTQERIVDFNPAMQQCISRLYRTHQLVPREGIIGATISDIMQNCPSLIDIIQSEQQRISEIEICSEASSIYFDVEISNISRKKQINAGKMILLRDITSYKMAVKEAKAARDIARALQETGTSLNSSLDIAQIMKSIMSQINRVLSFDTASVTLLEDESLTIAAISGLAESEALIDKKFSIDHHPNLEVLKKRSTVIFPNIQKDFPEFIYGHRYEIHSFISAPLIVQNKIIGFLNLASRAIDYFSENDKKTINAFAAQVAVALQNARLYSEAQRRLREQSILNDISRSISSKLDLSEFLERIHYQIKQYIDIENFLVVRFDEQEDEWKFIYVSDTTGELTEGQRFKKDDGLTGYVIQTQSALFLNNLDELTRFTQQYHRIVLAKSIKSWIGIPLTSADKIIGALVTYHHQQENYFSTHDFNLLVMISSQIAVAFQNAHLFSKMETMAITDTLTGLYNRRHFLLMAENELDRSMRYKIPISMIMLDIDHFKKVNDSYGHIAGDFVLQNIASICRHSLRKSDIIGRYGGEEFVILLPETGTLDALEAAERIRQEIKNSSTVFKSGKIKSTASIGVSSQNEAFSLSYSTLLEQADMAMYMAKQNGRDQVKLFVKE